MPHNSLKLIPGVDQNRTPTLNEMGISQSNCIRFIPDKENRCLVQKLGGWVQYYNSPIDSLVRNLHAWQSLNDVDYLGVAAESSLNTIADGSLKNITPQLLTVNTAINVSTTSGGSVVTITDNRSNITDYDSVWITTQISVGGLRLQGLYQCTAASSNTYKITSIDSLGNPLPATSTVTGGTIPSFATTINDFTVTVTLAAHGYSVGSTATFLVSTTVGGITIFGNYTVLTVPTANTFTISASNIATSTTSGSENGGLAQFIYYHGIGPAAAGTGYGIGGYGIGGYGGTYSTLSSPVTGRQFVTTATSGTGSVATVTFTGNCTIPIGSLVTLSGITPSGYNGNFVVTASTSNTISFVRTATGAQTVAGLITIKAIQGISGVTDWTNDNWGEIFLSCPKEGAIFQWSPSTGQPIAIVIPQAPPINTGMFVAMPQRQVIAYGSTFTGVIDHLLVRWCDVENYSVWIGTVTNQAGSYRIPKGSRIVGAIQGPQQGLIWTDIALWAMQYTGQPYIYSFNEIGVGCGLIANKAVGSMNGVVYWMSQSQFYKLAGSGPEPIFCPVWDVIFQDLDTDNLDKIRVAPNSRFGEISWFYPTKSSGGEVNAYVKYNIYLNCWDFGTVGRTAWINQSVLGPPIGAGPDRYIYQHEMGYNDGNNPMDSWFLTGYTELSDGDMMTFIDQLWPDAKWGTYAGVQNANLMITFYYLNYAGDTVSTAGPYTLTQATQYITPRIRARLVAMKFESTDSGTFWRLGNMRYRWQPDGKF